MYKILLFCLLICCVASGQIRQDPKDVCFVPKDGDSLFWKTIKTGAKAAAAEDENYNFIWLAPRSYNVKNQIKIIQALTVKRVDLIAVAPVSDEVLIPLKEAQKHGLKIATFQSGL